MRVLVAAGGSGGHLFPAAAVIKELQKEAAHQAYLLTSSKGKGQTIISELALKGTLLNMRGLPRSLWGNWFAFFRELISAYRATKKVFNDFLPEIVLAHGGYVTFPALYLARKRNIPYCLQEQNVVMGLTNRLFSRNARRIFSSLPLTGIPQAIDCGNPVREDIWEHDSEQGRKALGLQPEKFTLLVLGGSQGAKRLNQTFAAAWKEYAFPDDFQAIWATGEKHYNEINNTITASPLLKIFPFIKEMGCAYAAADLVISRAGATTISELNAGGRPAILIPYPYAADNHQLKNARFQVEKGAALMCEEKELTPLTLSAMIKELAQDRERLSKLAENSLKLGRQEAASFIVAEMEKVIGTAT